MTRARLLHPSAINFETKDLDGWTGNSTVLLGSLLLGVGHQGRTELGCSSRGTQPTARRDGAFMAIEARRCALRG